MDEKRMETLIEKLVDGVPELSNSDSDAEASMVGPVSVAPLSPQELAYLLELEGMNQALTMELGDGVLQLEVLKNKLSLHRRSLHEAYSNMLKMRGIREGQFDTKAGLIRIVSMAKKE